VGSHPDPILLVYPLNQTDVKYSAGFYGLVAGIPLYYAPVVNRRSDPFISKMSPTPNTYLLHGKLQAGYEIK